MSTYPMTTWKSRQLLAFVAIVISVSAFNPSTCVGQTKERSDSLALNELFAGQNCDARSEDIYRRAMAMEVPRRYQYLTDWVLPGPNHADLRLTVGYVASDGQADPADNSTQSKLLVSPDDHGLLIVDGGKLVSPAVELIEAAARTGQLKSVRDALAADDPPSPADANDRQAMLALIEIHAGQTDQAAQRLEHLFQNIWTDDLSVWESHDAVLLCLMAASRSKETAFVSVDAGQRIMSAFKYMIDRPVWHRYLWAAVANLKLVIEPTTESEWAEANAVAQQWYPVTVARSREHGGGFPASVWRVTQGGVQNLASHSDDYLFFRTPMQGSYSFEADVDCFGWRDSQLLAGGYWLKTFNDLQSYGRGVLRGDLQGGTIDPPLTDVRKSGQLRYRTRVDGDEATTFFNGRLVHRQLNSDVANMAGDEAVQASFPWAAIRSSYRHFGGGKDFRISGTPDVPEVVFMSDHPQLPGWYEYFHESNQADLADWSFEIANEEDLESRWGQINGRANYELAKGCNAESLLVYTRPVLEDGSVEYQFWYQPGKFEVHPAIGQRCLILGSDAVESHLITDGKFDRTGRRPDNRLHRAVRSTDVPDVTPLSSVLREGSWNTMMVSIVADQLSLFLNNSLVHRQRLGEHDPRKFGLFHYRDRTAARVRRVRWAGDWSTDLPRLDQQPLATPLTELSEDSRQRLTHLFEVKMGVDVLTSKRIIVSDGNPVQHFHATADGLEMNRPAESGYRNALLSPAIEVAGDFDITAKFDQLNTQSELGKTATVTLSIEAENAKSDVAALQRKCDPENEQTVQCLYMQTIDGDDRRHYFSHSPVEANDGRLRLSRRGSTVYYQFAYNDSDQFRLIGQTEFTADKLKANGIKFGGQIQGSSGFTNVRWTDFRVRAEYLREQGPEEAENLIAKLDEDRDQLAKTLAFDYSMAPPPSNLFYHWNRQQDRQWKASDHGLLVERAGSDHWSSTGIMFTPDVTGDFDATIRFDPSRLAIPTIGKKSSIHLQIKLDDDRETQLNSILARLPEGDFVAEGQMRIQKPDGTDRFERLGGFTIVAADRLRVVRRGPRFYILIGTDGAGDQLIGSFIGGDAPLPSGGIRTMIHTGGDGRSSLVLLNEFELHASMIDVSAFAPVALPLDFNQAMTPQSQPSSLPTARTGRTPSSKPPDPPPVKAKPRSFLQSIFDLF
ncbi:hypothetical protein K227x_30000 [Rubripirellula lacrimiformis]|uniref:3-keto-disaccharide hydrolase domain-containing protein n=1 Tax=Rubripirellula lacrimiformis TaxID=1930273 RepID=A0A517NBT3_9BACT|nr:DUF1583 domain-containing protein [Rubripirellula lacrimiformis]QDT04607.1 hypothetical protein K227x_30000 [Rubripirellula lacrimiformis]